MYIRPVHAELDVPTLHAFIRQYPLGLFTTSIPNAKHATLQTSHIPFVLDDGDDGGVLRGHIARANPQSKAIIESLTDRTKGEGDAHELDELNDQVLVLFNAPVHSYVTPKFYTATKPLDGKVVPTWDYAAVQVYGRARVYHKNDEVTAAFLQRQVEDLTEQNEAVVVDAAAAAAKLGGRKAERAWEVGDAPKRYVDLLMKGIIGLEIRIERIEGRFKLSQENGQGDWQGVVDGFRALGTEQGAKMAEMIEAAKGI